MSTSALRKGFTLIETLVAVSLLVIAVAGPMSLAAQSLSSAFYARDQVTAFHLAQEAIEAVRSVRDSNVLINAAGTPTDLLAGIPSTAGAPFTIDTRNNVMTICPGGTCGKIRNNGSLYGYGTGGTWADTRFTRSVYVTTLPGGTDEVRISVEVRWRSGGFQERSFMIYENLYRWVYDGT